MGKRRRMGENGAIPPPFTGLCGGTAQKTDRVISSEGDPMEADARSILDFWFEELTPADWFATSSELDERIRRRFGALHDRMSRMDADRSAWLANPEGSLALVILLDQFPRNIYRGTARAFASDALA